MARFGGDWRYPATLPTRPASMVSEPSHAAARSDDLGGEFRSSIGDDFRARDLFYTANWRSDSWDPGDDDDPYSNRKPKLQLDEIKGRASLLEGNYAAPISAPRYFDARFYRIQEPGFKTQEVGSRFCGNLWEEALIQDDDDGKIDGRQVFDEKFQRVTYMGDDQWAEFRNDIIKILERHLHGIKITGLRDLWDALDDEHDEQDNPPCNLVGRAATIQETIKDDARRAMESAKLVRDPSASYRPTHTASTNLQEVVADTNKAIELDPSMSKAYLRKGTACIKLEEYQTAKSALEAGLRLAPEDSRFTKLIKECEKRIAEETISLPKKVTPTVSSTVSPVSNGASVNVGSTQELPKPSTIAAPSKPKYRHDYYNSSIEVVLTIFAKGIPAEDVSIDFCEQALRVDISLPGEEPYHFQPRLFGKIVPEKCRYQVLGTKIEIHLFKAEAITWTSLEFSDKKNVPHKINTVTAANPLKPSYPSSRSKVDWDKLEAQVKKEEKEEKLDGNVALNKLFRDLYRDADEDTRRAMSKSFVESNGTVLSTNWKDVGSKKVEGKPPKGMELKKWEY